MAVYAYFLQRIKIKWGSCHHREGHTRLNTELVKKPRHLLEYVVVHERVHLIEVAAASARGVSERAESHFVMIHVPPAECQVTRLTTWPHGTASYLRSLPS